MHASKTLQNGQKTQAAMTRPSRFNVMNKDPAFDYSFRLRKDIEEGGGTDQYGFTPVGAGNSNGESWFIPGMRGKSKGHKQMVVQDVVLCRRPKEVADYYKYFEDQKYNQQMKIVRDFAKNTRTKFRNLDANSVVTAEMDGEDFIERGFTQKPGVTEGDQNG